MVLVAGVDGCPGGWLTVFRETEGGVPSLELFRSFSDLLAAADRAAVIAVDMPIGFPERAERGGRQCEREVRSVLGARQSSVFATPARAALAGADYRDACRINLAQSDPPRAISKQCYNLFAKIREIDALITPALQARVKECHPEFAFWALNGRRPLAEPKKLKSRPYAPGLDERKRLLKSAGYDETFLAGHPYKVRDVGADDLLDAAVLALTAERIHLGTAERRPADPPRDARGLLMEILG